MKNVKLKLAIFGAFGVLTTQVHAAGFTALPAAGFANSAYMSCYNANRVVPSGGVVNNIKGNFGSYPIILANYPAAGVNDSCWVAKPASEAILPAGKTGYTDTGSQTLAIPNPNGGASIGSVADRFWRNPTTNMCIIGTRVTMVTGDSDPAAGTQQFEVNDIARGGFSGSGTVNVAYTIFATGTTGSPVYRAGRTFTSVQHRALKYDTLANKEQNGTNYLDLPTKNSVTAATTGEVAGINSTTAASTSLATQDAVVNANYVDFTLDTVFADDDGSTSALSAFTYIEAPCTASPTSQANAIRLRQTGQENATQKQINMSGYAIGTP